MLLMAALLIADEHNELAAKVAAGRAGRKRQFRRETDACI